MDILKSVLEGKREFTKDIKDVPFTLDVYIKNQYTLHQLTFFLTHLQKPHTDYLNICKSLSIDPVSSTDAQGILDYISNYQLPTVIYDSVSYKAKKDYSFISDLCSQTKQGIETKSKHYYIVVPESLKSAICIRNIKEFLINKKFVYVSPDDNLMSEPTLSFVWNKHRFTAIVNIDQFTSVDWGKIACIFMDGSRWQTKHWAKQNLVEIFTQYPCYYVHENVSKKCYLNEYSIKRIRVDKETGTIDEACNFESQIMNYLK